MPVRKAGNFWLTIHDNHRSRQYRRKVIKITDDPLTDREETIGLLCAEIEQLQAELDRVKPVLDAARELEDHVSNHKRLSDDFMEMVTASHALTTRMRAIWRAVRAMEE